MRRLVLGNLRKTATDPVREASLGEVIGGELGETLGVVGGLEILEGEGVLEDLEVGGSGSALEGVAGDGGSDDRAGSDERGEGEELHCVKRVWSSWK